MRESIVIEKGIPIINLDRRQLNRGGGIGHPLQYPWDKIEVGDSFAVMHRATIRAARAWGNRRNIQFVSKQENKPPYLYRCWRIS